MTAIKVSHLDKSFKVWRHPSDLLREAMSGRVHHSEFQALSDVSFEVARGSVVGVLGRNGAGKSTLLRIIAGTLDATGGTVEVNGRISAILELGTGFHPDYTGRENIYLGGMCLGLSRAEIAARVDDIIAFSELSEFIDRPFRTFSSGMKARLTFSVATSVEPDILIIDEALSVGDARFALKSFDRIQAFKQQGRSILLVSHDINQVTRFCDHAILLDRGRVVECDEPSKVGKIYHELLFSTQFGKKFVLTDELTEDQDVDDPSPEAAPAIAPASPNDGVANRVTLSGVGVGMASLESAAAVVNAEKGDLNRTGGSPPSAATDGGDGLDSRRTRGSALQTSDREHRYGDGAVVITSIELRTPDDVQTTYLKSLEPYHIVCELKARSDVRDLCIGILVRNVRGIDLFGWDSRAAGPHPLPDMGRGETATVRLVFRNYFAGGSYFLTVSLARTDEHKHDMRLDALEMTVAPTRHIFGASVVDLQIEGPTIVSHEKMSLPR